MSIAMAVVEQIEEAPREAGCESATAVRLRVGELAGVVPDSLHFCFGLAASGTVLEGALLRIEPVTARASCVPCGVEWETGLPPDLCCPRCGRATSALLTGRELQIAAVEWADGPRVPVPTSEEP